MKQTFFLFQFQFHPKSKATDSASVSSNHKHNSLNNLQLFTNRYQKLLLCYLRSLNLHDRPEAMPKFSMADLDLTQKYMELK